MTFNFLHNLVRFTDEFMPYTEEGHWFQQIERVLIDVENWEARFPVEKSEFESLLGRNEQLAFEYVELYSPTSKFFVIEFEIRDENFQFYIMTDRQKIVLVFFRKII